eukprot:Sspe_Gene.93923::Locus_66419_Transcript_1_1_Confidence_1.000_Length_882::g.93923::m.93923
MKHPNIVRLLDVVHSDKKLTLVFNYLDQDLKKFLEIRGDLEPGLVQHFMRQLLDGIQYCHSRSVLHRDLKPQNLLISQNTLRLADFGLGRAFGIPVRRFTHEVVTLWYRAPDIILGSTAYGIGVDMWSIGCIFAEMATGQPLLSGKTESDQLLKIFQFLGTPSVSNWPSMNYYPNSASILSQSEFLQHYEGQCNAAFQTPPFQKLQKSGI